MSSRLLRTLLSAAALCASLVLASNASAAAGFSSTSESIATNMTATTAGSAKIVPDNWGAFYAFYLAPSATDANDEHLWVKKRAVGSTSWGTATDLTTVNGDVADQFEVVVDGSSNITVVFEEDTLTTTEIQTRTHWYASDTWSSTTQLSHPGQTVSNVQLAVNDYGDLVAVWEQIDGAITRIVGMSRYRGLTTTWSDAVWVSDPAAVETALDPDVAVDGDGLATAVWTLGTVNAIVETSSAAVPSDELLDPDFATHTALSSTETASNPRVLAHFGGTTHVLWIHSTALGAKQLRAQTRPEDPVPTWPAPAAADVVSEIGDEVGAFDVAMVGNHGVYATWSTNIPASTLCGIYARTQQENGTWSTAQRLAESDGHNPPYFAAPHVDATGMNTGMISFPEISGGIWASFRSGTDTVWNGKVRISSASADKPIASAVVGDWGGVLWHAPTGGATSDLRFTAWSVRPTSSSAPATPTGDAVVGSTVTSTLGSWSGFGPITYTRTWQRCTTDGSVCFELAGDSLSHEVVALDDGKKLRLKVTAQNAGGTTTAYSPFTAVVTTPAPVVAPTGGSISVTPTNYVGSTITATATFGGGAAPITYEWQRCDIAGANCTYLGSGASLAMPDNIMGLRPKVVATATNAAGSRSVSHLFNTTGRKPSSRCAGLAPGADPDGDALINLIECGIVREKTGGQFLDLPSLGADPLRKDIFLEIDAMPGHAITQASANRVMEAFEKSPLPNPDGTTGVRMHIDNGVGSPTYFNSPTNWGALSRASTSLTHATFTGSFDSANKYQWNDIDTIKSTNFDSVRKYAFFYVAAVHRYGTATNGSSGIARAGDGAFPVEGIGQDLIVSLAGFSSAAEYAGSTDEQAGTIMHELGHVLGLGHGGRQDGAADHDNYKPNYPSVMSYNWQMTGVGRVDGGFTLDYSRFGDIELDPLDEFKLLERSGVQAIRGAEKFKVMHACLEEVKATKTKGRFMRVKAQTTSPNTGINWNCSEGKDPISGIPVPFDINRTNNDGAASPEFKSTLRPRDDWGNIVFTGGAIGLAGAGPAGEGAGGGIDEIEIEPLGTPPVVATSTDVDRTSTPDVILTRTQAATGDRTKPTIRILPVKQRKGQKTVKVTVTVRDNRKLGRYVVKVDKVAKPYDGSSKLAKRVLVLKKGRHVITVTARDAVGNQHVVKKIIVVR